MGYLLRGTNDAGDPVEMSVECCWRCGNVVNVMLVSMEEHVESAHPLVSPPRHALDE